MNWALFRYEETGSKLYSTCSKRISSRKLSSSRYSTCCNYRNVYCIYYSRYQSHGCHLSYMASAFSSLCDYGIGPHIFKPFSKHRACYYRHNKHTVSLPVLDVFLRHTRTCGNYLYFFFKYNSRKLVYLRMHKHKIHAEFLLGKLLTPSYILTKHLRIHTS